MSFDRLIKKIIETGNPTVVGLDPKLDYVPAYLREEAFKDKGRDLKGAAAALLYAYMGVAQLCAASIRLLLTQCAILFPR